jgi:hypothetical protein
MGSLRGAVSDPRLGAFKITDRQRGGWTVLALLPKMCRRVMSLVTREVGVEFLSLGLGHGSCLGLQGQAFYRRPI